MSTVTVKSKVIKLNRQDAYQVVAALRVLQDDTRRITPEYPTYELYRTLREKLEVVKMKIASQM